jgi:hypothetical protein
MAQESYVFGGAAFTMEVRHERQAGNVAREA